MCLFLYFLRQYYYILSIILWTYEHYMDFFFSSAIVNMDKQLFIKRLLYFFSGMPFVSIFKSPVLFIFRCDGRMSFRWYEYIGWGKSNTTLNLFVLVILCKINCNIFSTIKNCNTDLFSFKQNQAHPFRLPVFTITVYLV